MVDPSAEEDGQESWTPYHYVFNNPVKNTDPDGKNPIIGFLAGAAFEYSAQVIGNIIESGGDVSLSSFTNVDGTKIGLAGAAGAVGAGLASGAAKLGSLAADLVVSNGGKAVVKGAISVTGDAVSSVVGSKIQGNKVTAGSVVADVTGGVVGRGAESRVSAIAKASPEGRQLARNAQRDANIAARTPERGNRQATAASSAKAAQNIGKTKAAVAGAVGSNAVSKGVGAYVNAKEKEKPKQ